MLKKLICLLLCAIMMPVGVIADEEETTQENTDFNERIDKLTYLGVTFDEGITYDAEVTRAKFIRTILDFVNTESVNVDCGFYDIDEDHPYFNEINTGASLGYMIGYTDGYYYPDEAISINEAIKVFVNALGYELLATQNGGYPNGYIATANTIGLLKGVSAGDNSLTYDIFAKLLENALECEVYELSIIDGNLSYGNSEEIDALWKFHRIIKARTVVTANSVTGMEDVNDKTLDNTYVKLNGETVLVGQSNAADYLGYEVDAYVYYDENEDMGEIRYVVPSSRNTTITIEPEYILEESNEFSAYNFVYETSAGRVKNIKLTQNTNVIFNGVAKADYSKDDLVPEIGNVTFIDNNGDGVYECVNIFNAQIVMVVDYTSKDTDGISVFDLKNSDNTYFYDDEYKNYVVYINGELNNPSGIVKGMVLTIGTNGEHSITYGYSNTVKGTINSISNGADGEMEKVVIDDVEYKLAPGSENYPFKVGASGEFYIDDSNYVYGFEKDVDTGRKYGYFISGFYDENEDPDSGMLKVLTEDNEIVRIFTNKKIKYNGSRKDIDKVMPELKIDDIDTNDWEPQVIMYVLDEAGKMSELYTVTPDGDLRYEGKFDTAEHYNHGYDFYADSWQNMYYQDQDTIFFNIYENDFEMSYVSGPLSNIARRNFVHEFYNIDENLNTVDVVVWKRTDASSATLPEIANGEKPTIVLSANTVLDADDMPVKELECFQAGKNVSIQWNEKAPEQVKETFQMLKPGDIIYYELDGMGRLSNMYRVFDIDKVGHYGVTMKSGEVHDKDGTAVHLEKRTFYVKLTRKLQNNFFNYIGYDETSGYLQKMNPSSEVYRMTVKNGKVRVETISYDDVKNGDEVLCHANTNTIWTMIVIDAQ